MVQPESQFDPSKLEYKTLTLNVVCAEAKLVAVAVIVGVPVVESL